MSLPIEQKFTACEYARFHDAVYEVTNLSLSEDILKELFIQLPDHLISLAAEWGLDDTEFCDGVIVYLRGVWLA